MASTEQVTAYATEKPWLIRPDWVDGKIKSSANENLSAYLTIGLVFLGLGIPSAALSLPRELPDGNYLALIVLLFPVVGAYLVLYRAQRLRAQRRYGNVLLVMSSVPATPGGALAGTVQTSLSFRPQRGIRLQLSCIRRRVSRGENGPATQDLIIWQDERILKKEAVTTESNQNQFPVFFRIPPEEPECCLRGREVILWRLEVTAKMSGPSFKAVFDVPVFHVAGATAGADPTSHLQMSAEAAMREEHSRIQVRELSGGREFFFPAARNLSVALQVTGVTLFWSFFVALGFILSWGGIFGVVFGLIDVFLVYMCVNFWLRQSRLTIGSKEVRAASRWLILGWTRRFATEQVERFEVKAGANSGGKVFYNIRLITKAGRKATVAFAIASKVEAEWLGREMNRSLG